MRSFSIEAGRAGLQYFYNRVASLVPPTFIEQPLDERKIRTDEDKWPNRVWNVQRSEFPQIQLPKGNPPRKIRTAADTKVWTESEHCLLPGWDFTGKSWFRLSGFPSSGL